MAFQFGKLTALVIGNSDYPPMGLGGSDLPGVTHDVQEWRRVLPLLADHQKYVDNEITFLENQTGAAMRAAIATLLDPNPKPGSSLVLLEGADLPQEVGGIRDTRLLVYCGHGSGVKDTSGDEPTGIDAALCGIDAQTVALDPNVGVLIDTVGAATDDQVSDLVRNAYKLAAVYVVYDCCHSGGAARLFGLPPQWLPRCLGAPFARQDFGPDHGRGPNATTPGRGLWLEAAAWNETAKEPLGGGGGFFTNLIMTALRDLDATPTQMHTAATAGLAHLASVGDPQTPQIEDFEGLAGKPFLRGHMIL